MTDTQDFAAEVTYKSRVLSTDLFPRIPTLFTLPQVEFAALLAALSTLIIEIILVGIVEPAGGRIRLRLILGLVLRRLFVKARVDGVGCHVGGVNVERESFGRISNRTHQDLLMVARI